MFNNVCDSNNKKTAICSLFIIYSSMYRSDYKHKSYVQNKLANNKCRYKVWIIPSISKGNDCGKHARSQITLRTNA